MRILITGNLGYVGPCVVRQLRATYPEAYLIGVDAGYFAGCLADPLVMPERHLDRQHFTDLRDIPARLFNNVDAVVHLAGLSNDPIGNAFGDVTNQVNYECSIDIAKKARAAGVRSFVFASSCSVYGSAEEAPRTEESSVNPLTAYARSKVSTELGLRVLADKNFVVTCLRFATACGMSPRIRLDLVLNDFVAAAVSQGEVRVLSNGTPWRPLIHVRDMARAIEWAITRESGAAGDYLVVNAGSDAWTFQVKDLATTVAACVPGAKISINRDAPDDKRSYKVDFGLFRSLAPNHQPKEQLTDTIAELRSALEDIFRTTAASANSRFIRLRVLAGLVEKGYLNSDLRWTVPASLAEAPAVAERELAVGTK